MWDNIGEDVYTGEKMWQRTPYIPHMKSKGRWQVLAFIVGSTDKYFVKLDYLTHKEANGYAKLLTEG